LTEALSSRAQVCSYPAEKVEGAEDEDEDEEEEEEEEEDEEEVVNPLEVSY
jgi:ribosomal protein L12E/L44/L45/RPP1/RPP2